MKLKYMRVVAPVTPDAEPRAEFERIDGFGQASIKVGPRALKHYFTAAQIRTMSSRTSTEDGFKLRQFRLALGGLDNFLANNKI